MCFDYDEYAEFGGTEIRKARKDHKCGCCHKPILKGQQYHVSSGLFDGSFFQVRTCNLCYQNTLTIVEHELREGCGWYHAWPVAEDQQQWFHDYPTAKRATEQRDIKRLYEELKTLQHNMATGAG